MHVKAADGKQLEIRFIATDATVADVCELITLEWGVPAAHQRLLFRGKRLQANQRLSSVGLEENSEILLRSSLKGGCLCIPTGNGGMCGVAVCNVM